MKRIKNYALLAGILFCVFLGGWTAQDNAQDVAVKLLGFDMPSGSLGAWLLAMLAVGVLLGLGASAPLIMRYKSAIRRLNRNQ